MTAPRNAVINSGEELTPASATVDARTSPKMNKQKKIPGEAGVWIFILGDMSVFAVFFTYYLVQRSKQPELFDASQATSWRCGRSDRRSDRSRNALSSQRFCAASRSCW
jgi:heme/copper-type cytochrome/quinol oxidase subunit 3